MNRNPAEDCWFRPDTEVLEQFSALKRDQEKIGRTSLHPSELVYVTHCGNVLSNSNSNRSGFCSCNHEKADTMIFVHVEHTTLTQMLLL
jgi:hypothetical protein